MRATKLMPLALCFSSVTPVAVLQWLALIGPSLPPHSSRLPRFSLHPFVRQCPDFIALGYSLNSYS